MLLPLPFVLGQHKCFFPCHLCWDSTNASSPAICAGTAQMLLLIAEIRGLALPALARTALSDISELAIGEEGFHFHFTSAGAVELLGSGSGTGVLAYISHIDYLLSSR
jgi:hypothetical protein